jgi:hypothetical protein
MEKYNFIPCSASVWVKNSEENTVGEKEGEIMTEGGKGGELCENGREITNEEI